MNSFSTRETLTSSGKEYRYHSVAAVARQAVARLPYSLKILLENLLRFEDGSSVTRTDIQNLLAWEPGPRLTWRSRTGRPAS